MTTEDPRLNRLVTIREASVLLGWNRQRAGRWLRKHPGARKLARGYVLPLARLMEAFPEVAMDVMELSEKLGAADEISELRKRFLATEARVLALEQTVRRMRAERRKQLAEMRRLKIFQVRDNASE